MDTGGILDEILKLRRNSPEKVADYLLSTFQTDGLHPQKMDFFYSQSGNILVGLVAFLLTAVFIYGVLKRRTLLMTAAAFAIPIILLLELLLHAPVVSWPVLKKGDNVIVQFPVQNASQKVVLSARYGFPADVAQEPSAVEATVSAFLLPAALALLAMGIWRLVVHFGKLHAEDARTVMLVMGITLLMYFAAWTAISWKELNSIKQIRDPQYNCDSLALLSELAINLGNRSERLQRLSVTIAFFGGSGAQGAEAFDKNFNRRNTIDTVLIDCREVGREGGLAFVVPLEESKASSLTQRRLLQSAVSADSGIFEQPANIILQEPGWSVRQEQGMNPSMVLTSLASGETAESHSAYDVAQAQVLPTAQALEKLLEKLDDEQSGLEILQTERK